MSASDINGSVMVCGTASNSGKSLIVGALCRVLARRGVSVAPFKGQNMSLNSVVTAAGAEIGRAQGAQAEAAGIEPEVAMNPVLLKPMGERRSQVVVMGRPWRVLDAADYQAIKPELRDTVLDALADLRRRFDVVVLEGAGSPAEINLLEGDLVNLGLADAAGIPAVVVGDIDRGGVFAHLFGTVELRRRVHGFIINKLRGDPALLGTGPAQLFQRTGVPMLGVIPWLDGVAIDAEDSLALSSDSGWAGWSEETSDGRGIDVAAIRFPRVSNFTDLDALASEPGVSVRWVSNPGQLADPDIVVLPGTKATVADLEWLRSRRLDGALRGLLGSPRPPAVLGICGGYQMLGHRIVDEAGVESTPGTTAGLGLLDVETIFRPEKRTRRRRGRTNTGTEVTGYEIHHGTVSVGDSARSWFDLDVADGDGGPEGVADPDRGLYGTTLHGVFENDALRGELLASIAGRRGKEWQPSGRSFADVRRAQLDRVADACEAHVDIDALWRIVGLGRAV
jgi:adenosylcobyric acid synthase